MTLAHDLERERAALTMIHGQPFNAEAPPEALETDITPTELHYVRSNFPVPNHDGRVEIGGAVEHPFTLSLDDLKAMRSIERVVTLECAGNGRLAMRPLPAGEPWGDYAVSTARWKGALLHEVIERSKPLDTGVEVLFAGVDHGSYILNPVLERHRCLATSPSNAHCTLVHAADPAAEIMVAYEMNGEPLNPDHGAPDAADRAALVRGRIGQMVEPDRGAHAAIHRGVRNRALHVPVGRSAARARNGDAATRAYHCPAPRNRNRRRHKAPRPRESLVGHRTSDERRHQPHRRIRMATGAPGDAQRAIRVAELVVRVGSPRNRGARPSVHAPPMPPATSSRKSPSGTGWATATTPSKSSTSTYVRGGVLPPPGSSAAPHHLQSRNAGSLHSGACLRVRRRPMSPRSSRA